MKLCGLDVDFLNLRGQERYQHDSRIPVTSFGSPLEDAERRDFTMNSLFFNLDTQSVEDWLQRGLVDLRRGVLVTPLQALDTFRDDPLRVLRAIRFAVRYQFRLDDNLRRAAMHPEIHKALHVKISRERVGKELEGMLSGKLARPVPALALLSDLKLAGSVFCLPLPGVHSVMCVSGTICNHRFDYNTLEDAESDRARQIRSDGWKEARRCLELLPGVLEPFLEDESRLVSSEAPTNHAPGGGGGGGIGSTATTTSTTKVDRRLLPVAAFVLPMRFLKYRQGPKQPHRELNAVAHIMREGLKFKNADCAGMTLLMESVDGMAAFLQRRRVQQGQVQQQQVHQQPPTDDQSFRLEVGMMLRSLKDSWVTCLCLATVVLQRQSQLGVQDGQVAASASDWLFTARDVYHDIMVTHGLDRSWTVRPLLDGASLATALQVPKGPLVAKYLREQVRWMLLHPDGTREACEAHLVSLRQRGLDEMDEDDRSSSDNVPATASVAAAAAAAGRRSSAGDDDGHHLGASDGSGKTPSSPVLGGRQASERHFSKKIHVESMDLS
jgi:tRNA nucleotidyltransferase (CCA-adding enzyme)